MNKYQAEIVGGITGAVVTAGCLALTAGAGSVGCAALGGAAAGAATNLWKSKVQKTQKFSWGSLARDTVVGGAIGARTEGLWSVAAPVVRGGTAAVAAAASRASGALTSGARAAAATAAQPGRDGGGGRGRPGAGQLLRLGGEGVSAVNSVPASTVRFSQSSVNGVAEIEASMRANGWVGDAIDVVRMPDGGLTSLDNTRVLAAKRAGIDVQATIRGFDDALPSSLVGRFTTTKGGRPFDLG